MNTVKTNILNGQFPKGTLILGIGGGGANFLDYVQKNSPQPIRCIACDTKPEGIAYAQGKGLATLYLGKDQDIPTTPKKAKVIVQREISFIDKTLEGAKLLVVFTALGGATGTGVTPVIVERAWTMGIPIIAILTIPFDFEDKRRLKQAQAVVNAIKEKATKVHVFDMDILLREYGKLPMKEGVIEIGVFMYGTMWKTVFKD